MNINSLNISITRVSGSSIPLTDFSSINPIECIDQFCQVCQFLNEQLDIAVSSVTLSDIENGVVKMPFYKPLSWIDAQKTDTD